MKKVSGISVYKLLEVRTEFGILTECSTDILLEGYTSYKPSTVIGQPIFPTLSSTPL